MRGLGFAIGGVLVWSLLVFFGISHVHAGKLTNEQIQFCKDNGLKKAECEKYYDGEDDQDPDDDGDDPLPPPVPSDKWTPKVGDSFFIQLVGKVSTNHDADVYIIDLFDNPKSVVQELKSKGKHVVAYFSAGSYEDWRPDADKFPNNVKGRSNGWPGEKWLDIRSDVLYSIMRDRILLAKQNGYDAVDPDNVDGYDNRTGFKLTYNDQLNYNRMLSQLAHDNGLSIDLKNDLEQVKDLHPYFDFAINEQCQQYRECDLLEPFINSGKPVFHIEYNGIDCPESRMLNFYSLQKKLSLNAWQKSCN